MSARKVIRFLDKKNGKVKPTSPKGQYGRRILYNIIDYVDGVATRNRYLHATKGWKSRAI